LRTAKCLEVVEESETIVTSRLLSLSGESLPRGVGHDAPKEDLGLFRGIALESPVVLVIRHEPREGWLVYENVIHGRSGRGSIQRNEAAVTVAHNSDEVTVVRLAINDACEVVHVRCE